MAATITITAGQRTKTFNINTANQARIIAALDRDGLDRDPRGTGTDMNDFDFFVFYLVEPMRQRVFSAERDAAAAAVSDDPGLIT